MVCVSICSAGLSAQNWVLETIPSHLTIGGEVTSHLSSTLTAYSRALGGKWLFDYNTFIT